MADTPARKPPQESEQEPPVRPSGTGEKLPAPRRRPPSERSRPSPPPSAASGTGVTTGALARRLGVSPTTLRSWDRRYGVGPAVRDGGRHRRWAPQDVAVLEEMCRLTSVGVPPAEAARAARERARTPAADTPPAPRAGRPAPAPAGHPVLAPLPHRAGDEPLDARREIRGLSRAAVRLDAAVVQDRLLSLVARYGVSTAWEEVMVPTLHAVGRRWETSGDRYVEVEHLLSWHVSTVLRRATPAVPPGAPATDAAPLVLACVPGEQHTLPLEALNAALAERGTATRMFGADVPAEALTSAVRRLGPAAVVLWSQARSTASHPLAQYVAASEWGVRGARRNPVVVLGGPGWAGQRAGQMLRPAGLGEALRALTAVCGGEDPSRT